MINFRYHVVSLTAVFLALAIGLILGTAALNGPVADNLNNQVSSLNKRNGQLREEAQQLQNQVDSSADYVKQTAPVLLADRLKGRSVLVVTTDTTDQKSRDAVVEALTQAGAEITGTLRIDAAFTDPKRDDALQDLATRLVPADVDNLPNNGIGVETASALLATTLLKGGPTVSASSRTSILSGFGDLPAATNEGNITEPADAVVFVAGQGATDADAEKRNQAMLTIARQFDRVAQYMVVAGQQAGGTGSLVGSVRGDGQIAKTVSTVDNVSSPEGQVATALALAKQFDGSTGHYGSGDGASARVPPMEQK